MAERLDAVAVGVLLVLAARVVGVEEVLREEEGGGRREEGISSKNN